MCIGIFVKSFLNQSENFQNLWWLGVAFAKEVTSELNLLVPIIALFYNMTLKSNITVLCVHTSESLFINWLAID